MSEGKRGKKKFHRGLQEGGKKRSPLRLLGKGKGHTDRPE